MLLPLVCDELTLCPKSHLLQSFDREHGYPSLLEGSLGAGRREGSIALLGGARSPSVGFTKRVVEHPIGVTCRSLQSALEAIATLLLRGVRHDRARLGIARLEYP